MSKYILSCCSTADMPESFFNERNIPYVCFHYTLDGKEYADDLGKSVPFEEFYKKIADGSMPTTSQVNTDQYVAFFEPFLKDGYDIVHLSFSSGLSGSYNSARIARNDLVERYPERNIRIVDTLAASGGYGLLVDIAADMRDHGATIDEIADQIEEMKLNLHHWFFTTDLTHFKRGGRVSAATAVVGSMLQIKPVMHVDNEGHLIKVSTARGRRASIKALFDKIEETAIEPEQQIYFISHGDCLEDAEELADMIRNKYQGVEVVIDYVGAVIGAHSGPGTLALFFLGSVR